MCAVPPSRWRIIFGTSFCGVVGRAILDGQLAVDGEAGNYPEFAGNVKTVYAHPLSEGGSSNAHYSGRAGT